MAATVGSGRPFRNGREFAGWLGLTPRNHSSGKERLGKITMKGDHCPRQLIVVGMTSRVGQVTTRPDHADPRRADLLHRKPARLATTAMAHKTARIMWAVPTKGDPASDTQPERDGAPETAGPTV
ncbi:MAG: transposase [Rhodobacteraceae bacterium]|nr:transposase [Paracoccaceae bacterium]